MMDDFEKYFYCKEQEIFAIIVSEFRRAFYDAGLCDCKKNDGSVLDCVHVRSAIEKGFKEKREYLAKKGKRLLEG